MKFLAGFCREVDDRAVVIVDVVLGIGLGVHVFIFLLNGVTICSDLRLTLSTPTAAGDCRWRWEERRSLPSLG